MSPTAPVQTFGEQVQALADRQGLSLRKVAERAGVSAGHLHHVMKGEQSKRPTRELIERVAVALQVQPEHFGEFRAIVIADAVPEDPVLRDRLYAELQRG